MRYHDYHLVKYEVSDSGETIVFHLAYEYPEQETLHSNIKFLGVAFYNFIHTTNAIIIDIEEVSLSDLLDEIANDIQQWSRMFDLRLWKDNLQNYRLRLQSDGYKAWRIESAIGFYGFVIAKSVSND